MHSSQERLKELLLADNILDPKDFDQALEIHRKTNQGIGSVLVERGVISEEDLARVYSKGMNIPQVNLSRLSIDPLLLKMIPQDVAEKNNIMPVSIMDDVLAVAMADPMNLFTLDNIRAMTGYIVNPVIASLSDIKKAIVHHYSKDLERQEEEASESNETFDEIISDIRGAEDLELVKESSTERSRDEIEELSEEAPIIKLTDTIIKQAVLAKASDVFIEPMEKSVRIRYRIDGVIREIDRLAKVLHFPIVSRIKVISQLDISEHRLPQDGRFKTILSQSRSVDFRVSVLPTAMGEKVVLRILDQEGTVLDVEGLGFEPNALEHLKDCAVKPHGMILTCGPTGSGKTTTLYSILKYVDSPEKNIVTVEDPVEYQMKGVNQVNVKPQMGLTFSTSLRSILRQDPDIILIGEIRDAETLDIAVKAALTGHLVLSSLHTTTAAGSIVRMINMGIQPFLICSSVLAIVAQRLVRKICANCKEEYELPMDIAEKTGLTKLKPQKKYKMFRGKGCKKCFKTGYLGRVGITEILLLSPTIKELILKEAGEYLVKEQARKEGMQTMREDALLKAVEGLTSVEEVLRMTAPDSEGDS